MGGGKKREERRKEKKALTPLHSDEQNNWL